MVERIRGETLGERQEEARRLIRRKRESASIGLKADAFEYYYGLGLDRSLSKVSRKFGRPLGTLQTWSARYDWDGKVREREAELDRRLAEVAAGDAAATRMVYTRKLDLLMDKLINDISELDPSDKNRKFPVRSIADMEKAAEFHSASDSLPDSSISLSAFA